VSGNCSVQRAMCGIALLFVSRCSNPNNMSKPHRMGLKPCLKHYLQVMWRSLHQQCCVVAGRTVSLAAVIVCRAVVAAGPRAAACFLDAAGEAAEGR
jgi:hypothetical protein